jgi:hypothetical protein
VRHMARVRRRPAGAGIFVNGSPDSPGARPGPRAADQLMPWRQATAGARPGDSRCHGNTRFGAGLRRPPGVTARVRGNHDDPTCLELLLVRHSDDLRGTGKPEPVTRPPITRSYVEMLTLTVQPVNYLNRKCCAKPDRGSYSRSQKVLRELTII